jgi:predicted nucleic acid-binding protein
MIKCFFDSPVIFSALYSKEGASYALAELVKKKVVIGVITMTVVEEVLENLKKLKDIKEKEVHQFIWNHGFVG